MNQASDTDQERKADAATGRKSAGPQRSEATHAAILEAAETLLIEGGAAAVTFEAVARRAKAGKPTIYRWWPTKAALLLEVYDRHKDRVVTAPNLGDFRSDLIVLTQALWTFWRETSGGSAFAAIIAEAQSNRETQHTLVNHYADGTRNHINSLNIIIEQAIVRGELANGTDVQRVREAIMAMNWFHLLCGKLDQERIPDVVGRLVDGVLSK